MGSGIGADSDSPVRRGRRDGSTPRTAPPVPPAQPHRRLRLLPTVVAV